MMLTLLISLLLSAAWPTAEENYFSQGFAKNQFSSTIAMPTQSAASEDEDINISELIFDHIGDDYEWHITEWKGKAVAIPLPCIVIENGVHIFTAHHAAENGYTFNENGKLVNANTGKRPIDISITKNVLALMISTLLLLIIILYTANWYK